MALQCLFASAVAAHEIEASVIDLSTGPGQVTLVVETNLEARLAGIGAEHDNTETAPQKNEYDALRALAPAALSSRVTDAFANRILVTAGADRVPLRVEKIDVPEAPDLDLARMSRVALVGDLPDGTASLTLAVDTDFGDLILRGTGANADYSEYLQPGQTSKAIAVEGGTKLGFWETFRQYLFVGFEHIVPLGLDHILFVIGLFLLDPRWRSLLWQVSAFTLAHTVTLALATLDIVRVPGEIVEPLIALSIVYIAVENVVAGGWKPWRPILVFAFGLLHGLGFASVFEAYGIPEGQLVASLLAFNIGVEIGQLAVLAGCFLVLGAFRSKAWYRPGVAVPLSLAIAAVGAWWLAERTGILPFAA